jgi:hypothetical protein
MENGGGGGADSSRLCMSDTPTPTPTTDDVRNKAAQVAGAGVQSYTHGSRTVNRSNPNELLDAADRLDRREARRKRGICAIVSHTVGVI